MSLYGVEEPRMERFRFAGLSWCESMLKRRPRLSECCWQTKMNKIDAMVELGKVLLLVGAVMVVAGVVLLLAGRFHLPFGRMPGDIVYRGKNTVFYFPLATSLLFSLILSLILWLIGRSRH